MEAAAELGPEMAAQLLSDRPAEEIAKLIQEIPSDDAAALVDYLPEELSTAVLELMRPKESGQVGNLLEFPEKTAGRIMNPNVFALSEDLTVGEGISQLQSSRDVEMVFYLYIVDGRRHLVGVTSLRRLLLVSPETPLKRIMTPDVISVRVDTDQEEAARLVASYNLLAIPVVDEENKLVGVVTVDDVIDVIKDEATEDIYRLAGVTADERVFTPPGESLTKRLPWLAVNLVTAFLAAVGGQPVRAHDRSGRGAGGLHADRGRHGRQRRDADADRDRARHRAGRADLGEHPQGAVQGGAGRPGQRAGARAPWAPLVVWLMKGNPVLGGVLGLAMVINMFIAATAGTLIPLGLARAEGRSGAGQLGVHHDVHRRGRIRVVSRPGDGVPEVRRRPGKIGGFCASRPCHCTPPTRWCCAPTSSAKPTGSSCS